ncbi:hypothetical protein CEE39_08735 [bacterium (candidate division B38) B3_B38]|nr:MAG: hypothetical protein CEE39_08735 [bacterium (candidate division B38) B3_B38]
MLSIPRLYQLLTQVYAAIPEHLFRGGYAFPPLRVAFILTHRCNLKCRFCMVWSSYQKERKKGIKRQELSLEEVKGLIDQLPGYSVITFTGGEPFLRKDLMTMLRFATKRHRCHIVTNGTLCREEEIEEIVARCVSSIWGKGVLSVGISIEAVGEVHDKIVGVPGSFDKTLKAIKSFQHEKSKRGSRYPLVDLKITIGDYNFASLRELYDLAVDLKVDLCSFQVLNTQSSSYGIEDKNPIAHLTPPKPFTHIEPELLREQLRFLVERSAKAFTRVRFNPNMPLSEVVNYYLNRVDMSKFTCHTPWHTMHIGPYGEAYPCFSYPMGNVREKKVSEIWNGETYKGFRRKLREEGVFPGCAGCCIMEYKG